MKNALTLDGAMYKQAAPEGCAAGDTIKFSGTGTVTEASEGGLVVTPTTATITKSDEVETAKEEAAPVEEEDGMSPAAKAAMMKE